MKRRKGRPKLSDGPVVTREELLVLFAKAMGKSGPARVSMRGVARDAGISLATLQNHFKTKPLLIKAVLDELISPAENRPRANSTDVAAFLRGVVHERLEGAARYPGLTAWLLINGLADQGELLEHLANTTEEIRRGDVARIKASMEAGLLQKHDVHAVVVLLGIALPLLSSATDAIARLVGPDLEKEPDRHKLADAIADVLLYGLLPR